MDDELVVKLVEVDVLRVDVELAPVDDDVVLGDDVEVELPMYCCNLLLIKCWK